MEVSIEALRMVFPEELLLHFELTGAIVKKDKRGGDFLEVEFVERNQLPQGYSVTDYETKDFVERRIQDFPLRGKPVYLVVKRRRWRHKESGETLIGSYTFVQEGTRLTQELAAFLKELGR